MLIYHFLFLDLILKNRNKFKKNNFNNTDDNSIIDNNKTSNINKINDNNNNNENNNFQIYWILGYRVSVEIIIF